MPYFIRELDGKNYGVPQHYSIANASRVIGVRLWIVIVKISYESKKIGKT